jgi:hypothetical protein
MEHPTTDAPKMATAAWCTGNGGSQTKKKSYGEISVELQRSMVPKWLRLHGAQGMAEARQAKPNGELFDRVSTTVGPKMATAAWCREHGGFCFVGGVTRRITEAIT